MSDDKLDTLIDMVERLNTAVIGDKPAGVEGLAARVRTVEKKTEDALTGLRKFYTIGGTLSVIWGGIVSMIAIFKDKIW